MRMSYDQVRGRMWTKSCLGRIRKVPYTPQSCDHALFEAKCCTDFVTDHRWLRVHFLDISADADQFTI